MVKTYMFDVTTVVVKAHPEMLKHEVFVIIRQPGQKIITVDNPEVLWDRAIQTHVHVPGQLPIPYPRLSKCVHTQQPLHRLSLLMQHQH